MIAARQTRVTGLPERLRAMDGLSRFHRDRAEMAVERVDAEAVIHDDRITINPEIAGKDHDAILRRLHGAELQRREIEAEVCLMINDVTMIRVGAAIGERA